MHKIYLFFIFLMLSAGLMAQTIASQDFEVTPVTPTMTYAVTGSGTSNFSSGQSSSTADAPASTNLFANGARGYRFFNTTPSRTITFDAINTSTYNGITFSIRLASFSIGSTANGADAGDNVTVDVSPDNGTTWYSRVRVAGNTNARWSFTSGTGTASNTYAANSTFSSYAPTSGGSRTADGYSTITISDLPAVNQLRVRLIVLNNDANESWIIDDAILTGTLATSPNVTLTTTNFNGVFGNVNVGASSASSSFTVSGSNLTNDITVTPPTGGFEIRTGSNTFSTAPIVLTQVSGSVTSTTIDARFTPAAAGAQSGNITASSTGATDRTVAVSGTGVAVINPTKLAITGITPTNPTVNTAFNVTVQAQDASNTPQNVVAATNVTLSVSTGTGTLGGTITGTIPAGSNQVVITGATYNTAETGVVLTAARTAGDALASGNSASFNVIGVATQLAFVNFPASGSVGTNVAAFTVETRRADNTVDANYTGNVTLSIASGTGNITGTLTKAAVSGVATFNDIKFDAAGSFTLSAASTGLTSAVSGTITISAAPVVINPGELLINQFSPGYNTANDEYVELVNVTNKTLDLSTIALRYLSSGNGTGLNTTLTGTLAPYSYLLLSSLNNTTITVGQTTAISRDGSFSSGSFSGSAGQIAIVRVINNVSVTIDALAYGNVTGGTYTEGTSAAFPSGSVALRRVTEGVDGNNNNTDFATVPAASIDLKNATSRIANTGSTVASGSYNRLYVTGNSSLGGAVTLTGRLILGNNGILTSTTANPLRLATTATVSGGSNTAYVDGPVIGATNSTSAITLPLGKAGAYKPVIITPTTATASEYTAEYFATTTPNAPLESRLNAIQTNEYWLVDRTAGTAPATIGLNYNSTGATWSNGMNPSVSDVISIVHLRSSNNTWTQEYGTTVPNNTNTASLTTGTISDFSPFTFGYGPTSVLPVVITSFTGTKTATGNILNWKVVTETNFKEYVVEKSVGNGSNFKSIATVSATQSGSYSTTDAQPAGYNYYRLKLVDRDGKISYSKTVLVINETKGFAISNVYPTVTTGAVVIESYAATPVKATIRVINQAGQSVYTQTVTLAQASLTNINLSLLAKGNYLMQVLADGYSKTVKIVKQ